MHQKLSLLSLTVIIENNNLEGSIPSEISSLTQLESWAMEQGRLQSTIPASIFQLTNLLLLDLDFNFLTGKVTELHFQYCLPTRIVNDSMLTF